MQAWSPISFDAWLFPILPALWQLSQRDASSRSSVTDNTLTHLSLHPFLLSTEYY
jgi:hypothetical protein